MFNKNRKCSKKINKKVKNMIHLEKFCVFRNKIFFHFSKNGKIMVVLSKKKIIFVPVFL